MKPKLSAEMKGKRLRSTAGVLQLSRKLVLSLGLLAGDCVPPSTNLVAWWRGDGSATDFAGTNHATLPGGASATAPGLVGQCFSLDGFDDGIVVPNSPALQITGPLSVEA